MRPGQQHWNAESRNRLDDRYDDRQRAILSRISHLVPNSHMEHGALMRTLGVSALPFTVAPYGVDPKTFLDPDPGLFTRKYGRLLATPLFAVLILVETTDVVFAVDSIPAILAVSREPFIVFSSNAFAILGLRALYFLLAGMAGRFRYLNLGLGVILAFVGVKMMIVEWFHFPTYVSLGVIALVLTVTIWASLRAERRDELAAAASGTPESKANARTDSNGVGGPPPAEVSLGLPAAEGDDSTADGWGDETAQARGIP